MEHNKEPWRTLRDGILEMNNVVHFISDAAGCLVAYGNLSEANARRIVACVNACAGIPTEQLEAYPGAVMRVMKERYELRSDLATAEQDSRQKQARIDRLEREREEMLVALDDIAINSADDSSERTAREAIASAKGGACKHCNGKGVSQISDPCICQYGKKGGEA